MESAKCVLWLTGENGSGRDALARDLESQLRAKNYLAGVFDAAHLSTRQPESSVRELERHGDERHGDERHGDERHGDERLAGSLNDLLVRDDVVIVAADDAPPSGLGEQVGRKTDVLIEVFLRPSLEAGREDHGDGSHDREVPVEAASRLVMDAGADARQGNVELILARLETVCGKQGVGDAAASDYSVDDEEIIRRRLEDLGYI